MTALFPLPVMGIVSAAMVVTVTQHRGWREGVLDTLIAAPLVAALTAAAGGSWIGMGAGALATWLTAALLGSLSRDGNLVLAIQVATLMGMAAVVGVFAWSGDPLAYWEGMIRELAARASGAGLSFAQPEALLPAARWMTGLFAASGVVTTVLALVLGTWWGRSVTPGAAFARLRMGAVIGGSTVAAALLMGVGAGPWADNLLVVAGVAFAMQGLALLHWHGRRANWPKAWPWAVYLPMVIAPTVAAAELIVFACIGLVDNVVNFRRRTDGMV